MQPGRVRVSEKTSSRQFVHRGDPLLGVLVQLCIEKQTQKVSLKDKGPLLLGGTYSARNRLYQWLVQHPLLRPTAAGWTPRG